MADESDDLEYSEANVGSAQAQGVRKNISLKLKGKGRGRGKRGGKAKRTSTKKTSTDAPDDEVEEPTDPPIDKLTTEKPYVKSNLEEVISKLETPAFSPLDRSFPEPIHREQKLRWDHKVNLIGEKLIDPLIHCCEKCSLPILNYGRLIPCKHVCCYDCSKKCDKICPKCEDKVQRIEQSTLGTVFMCTYGGGKHMPGSCGRTYLSQRDLQAHVNHRHLKPLSASNSASTTGSTSSGASSAHPPTSRDPRAHLHVDTSHQPVMGHLAHGQEHRDDHSRTANVPMGSPAGQIRQYPHSPASYQTSIPVSSARPNLITVPIQDDGAGILTPAAQPPPSHLTHAPPPQYQPPAATPHPSLPIQHPPSSYYQQHPSPAPVYSQAPPLSTQTFSQPPPPVHLQPPLHAGGPIYSNPPPVVHHQTYTPPRGPPRPMPPQHFPPQAGSYEENPAYMQQWPQGGVPPPPARTALPPRPITAPPPSGNPNIGHLPPRGPSDPTYRQPYYQ